MAVDQLELVVITGMSGAGKLLQCKVSKTWDISVSIICRKSSTKILGISKESGKITKLRS